MKKISKFTCILAIIISCFGLVGCSGFTRIEYISDWSAQYDEDSGTINVFFGLQDANNKYTAAYADVDVRIEDKSGNVLYEDTTYIDESNFGTYFNEIKGNICLAKLEIPVSEILPGVSSEGIIYITVSNEDKFYFDETEVELHGGLSVL